MIGAMSLWYVTSDLLGDAKSELIINKIGAYFMRIFHSETRMAAGKLQENLLAT
jgi:hypothetical protein